MEGLEFRWGFEVKSEFRQGLSVTEREAEFERLTQQFPSRVPVVVEPLSADTGVASLPKSSFLPPQNLRVDQFMLVVSRRIGSHEGTFQLYLNGRLLRSQKPLMTHYNDERGADGFLYLNFSYGQEVLVVTTKSLQIKDDEYTAWVQSIVSTTHSKKMFAGRVLDVLSSYAPVLLTDTACKGKAVLLIVPFEISKFSFVEQVSAILGMDVDLFVGDQHMVKGRTHVAKLYSIWKEQTDGMLHVQYRDKSNCRVM